MAPISKKKSDRDVADSTKKKEGIDTDKITITIELHVKFVLYFNSLHLFIFIIYRSIKFYGL